MNALENFTNKTHDVLLTSLLKHFALIKVKFYHKPTGTGHHLMGFTMKYLNFKRLVYYKLEKRKYMYHILVFINVIVFQNVCLLWLIKTKETN